MPVESASDRAVFLSPDEFGTAADYRAVAGVSTALTGLFENPHAQSSLGIDARPSTSRPRLTVRSADLPAGAAGGDAGDTVEIAGETFKVIDLEPDGTGLTVIVLGK